MYALEEDLARVREEEARNQDARAGRAEPAVSVGLQGDAIQPLTLRVNQGECLRIALRNDPRDSEAASLHLHGSGLRVARSGAPAIATNPEAIVAPGETVIYEWAVPDDEPEGTHYFHSHGNARNQTNHGLFGAVIVEPRGSAYLDPLTGEELRSGWAAIVRDPAGSDFREFALYYHEVGNERYRHLDKDSRLVVQVDPFTSSYRPGDRALNYRSEPFRNRMVLQQQMTGRFDKSAPYSSYTLRDPATPIARSYLRDPAKERVIHGGSEVFHVHHLHGGGRSAGGGSRAPSPLVSIWGSSSVRLSRPRLRSGSIPRPSARRRATTWPMSVAAGDVSRARVITSSTATWRTTTCPGCG